MKLHKIFACALGAMTLSSCDNPGYRAETRAEDISYDVAVGCYAISAPSAANMNSMTDVADPKFPLMRQFVNEVALHSRDDVRRKIIKEGISKERFENDLAGYETLLKDDLTLAGSIVTLYTACTAYAEPETIKKITPFLRVMMGQKSPGVEI